MHPIKRGVILGLLLIVATTPVMAEGTELTFAENRMMTHLTEPFTGPVTIHTLLKIDRSNWQGNDVIHFAELALDTEAGPIVLALRAKAVPLGWFGTAWELELYSEAGMLGDAGRMTLPGTERLLLERGDLFRSHLSYDPASGEISVGLWNVTRGQELVRGFAYGERLPDPLYAGVRVGSQGITPEQPGVQVQDLSGEAAYTRMGHALVLQNVQAAVLAPLPSSGPYTLLRLNEDTPRFLIRRPAGPLPGQYRLYLPEQDEVVFETDADRDVVEVDLGLRGLPVGTYEGVLYYAEPGYEQEVARLRWRVAPPEVGVDLSFSTKIIQLMLGPAQLTGEIVLSANQDAEDVALTVHTQTGREVMKEKLSRLPGGVTRIPFRMSVDPDTDLTETELTVMINGRDMEPTQRRFLPLGVSPAVRDVLEVQVEVATFFGNEPQTEARPNESLVRVWVTSDTNKTLLEELVMMVHFTSPDGENMSIPARRIALPAGTDPLETSLEVKMRGASSSEIGPDYRYHWFADFKPETSGPWRYAVEVLGARPRLEHIHLDPLAHVARKYWRWTDPPSSPGRLLLSEGSVQVHDPGVTESTAPGAKVQALRYVPGSTVKLEQVTGDWDKHFFRPTLNQTLSRYAVGGTDLGRTFEHDGKLILLFGDTEGTEGFIQSFVAHSTTVDPEAEGGLRFDIYTDRQGRTLRLQPPGLSMGGFEVPTGGISLGGKMYILVRTSWHDGFGRSVLVHLDEATRRFHVIRELSPIGGKFVEVEMRFTDEQIPGLSEPGPHILLWGTGERYRQSPVYLGVVPAEQFETGRGTRYYAGLDANGVPQWAATEAEAVPVIRNVDVGEFSIIQSQELGIWIFMYADRVYWSETPWGPWNGPILLPIEPIAADAFQYRRRSDPYLAGPTIGPEDPYREGGPYGHYMIERFTKVDGDVLRLYYLISTWNPYEVVLMRSDFTVERDGAR